VAAQLAASQEGLSSVSNVMKVSGDVDVGLLALLTSASNGLTNFTIQPLSLSISRNTRMKGFK
jgi:hypothetical protein